MMQSTNPRAEPPPTIFISYRRAETLDLAGRLIDELKDHFGGRARVFRDLEDITAGDNFVEVIDSAIGASKVLVALIGRQWLNIADAKTGKRRLDSERDHVRLEIAAALKRNIRVIPVLVQNAEMPDEESLPDDLKPLALRNALELSSDKRWSYDLQQLVEALEASLPPPAATPPPGPPPYPSPAEQFRAYLRRPWGLLAALAVVAVGLVGWKVLPPLMGGDARVNNGTAPSNHTANIANDNNAGTGGRGNVNASGAATPAAPTPRPSPTGRPPLGTPRLAEVPGAERVSQEFKTRLVQVASELETDPNYLLAVMSFETDGTLDPSSRGPDGKAVGLLRFMPATTRALGTSTEELAAMSAERQLDFVKAYYLRFKGRLKSLEDVYMAEFLPSAVGKGADHVIFRAGGAGFNSHRRLDANGDGALTVGEVTSRVRSRLPAGYR